MVVWRARADGGGGDGTSRSKRQGGRHAGGIAGGPAVRGGWVLCGLKRDCGASTAVGIGVHLLGRSACDAGDDSQRSAGDAGDERRDAGSGTREHQDDVGSTGSAERVGALHECDGEPNHDPRAQGGGGGQQKAEHFGARAAPAGDGGRGKWTRGGVGPGRVVGANVGPGIGERGDDDSIEEHASGDPCDGEGGWMGAPTGTEGVPHSGTHAKGGGADGDGDSACNHQSDESEKMIRYLSDLTVHVDLGWLPIRTGRGHVPGH